MTVVEHLSAEELQALFQREREARVVKRIWIVWQARLGLTAPEIAQVIGMSRRTVQEWVRQYNTEGLAGLQTTAFNILHRYEPRRGNELRRGCINT